MSEQKAPMSTAANALEQAMARLADLARTALQSQASLAKHSADLARSTLAGDLDRTSASKAYAEALSREGARYWRALGELAVDYATDVIALGNHLSTTVLRETVAAGQPGTRHRSGATSTSAPSESTTAGSTTAGSTTAGSTTAGSNTAASTTAASTTAGSTQSTFSRTNDGPLSAVPDQSPDGRRVQVMLHGSLGGRAEGTITVANQHPRPRRIQLAASDLVNSAGAVVATALIVSPTRVTVPSGQERSVSLGVDLDDASFSAGERYTCTVDVTGGDEATIEVLIDVGA